MYCNSCLMQIPKDEITFCTECGVPLHKKCANKCLECGVELCDSCFSENHFRCSECYNPEKPFSHIRRSYIKQYEMCPHSLFLQLVEGVDPPMSKYAQLGILVHAIIEDLQAGNINVNQAVQRLDAEVEEWNMNTEDEYSIIPLGLLDVGFKCIQNFMDILPLLSGESVIEEKIQYSLDESLPDITCTLDRISFVDDKIHIHDWKTGKPMSGKKLVEDLQPPLYLLAVKSKYGKMPDSFTLHYLANTKNLTYRKVDDDTYTVKTARSEYTLKISEAVERTKKILEGISKSEYPIPSEKEVSWYCNSMCWYGLSGYCKSAQTEQWRKINRERENANS